MNCKLEGINTKCTLFTKILIRMALACSELTILVDQLSKVNSANAENLCFSREAAQHKEAIPSRINGIAAPSASLTV